MTIFVLDQGFPGIQAFSLFSDAWVVYLELILSPKEHTKYISCNF